MTLLKETKENAGTQIPVIGIEGNASELVTVKDDINLLVKLIAQGQKKEDLGRP